MITKRNYTIRSRKRKETAWMAFGIAAVGIFLGVAIFCMIAVGTAYAEEAETWHCWVMCRPGSERQLNEIMIRERPTKKADATGAAAAGDSMQTDYEEKGGWLHVVDLANETGDGWIFGGYIVYEEPKTINRLAEVHAKGRVHCRKWINGPHKGWVRSGDTVEVYMIADGWAVTNKGYIRCEYLEVPQR